MSFKTITTVLTALFAASFWFVATAQAGCGGGHRGFSKSYSYNSSYKAKQRARARARARAKAKAKARAVAKAKAKAKAARIAKAKAKAEAKRLANAKTESSFVATQSTAALLTDGDIKSDKKDEEPNQKIASTDTETTNATVVAVAGEAGCKRFVPAVGRTITVACE